MVRYGLLVVVSEGRTRLGGNSNIIQHDKIDVSSGAEPGGMSTNGDCV
jgi:hypothetical protein